MHKSFDPAEFNQWVFSPHVALEDAMEAGHIRYKGRAYSQTARENYTRKFGSFCQYILERQLCIFEIDSIEIAQFLELQGLCALSSANLGAHAAPITPFLPQRQSYLSYLSVLDTVMKFLITTGLRDNNPIDTSLFQLCDVRDHASDADPCVSPEQDVQIQQFLLSRLPVDRWQTRRDVAMTLFMLGKVCKSPGVDVRVDYPGR